MTPPAYTCIGSDAAFTTLRIPLENVDVIDDLLRYTREDFHIGRRGSTSHKEQCSMLPLPIADGHYIIHTGLMPRLSSILISRGWNVPEIASPPTVFGKPSLTGIDFREEQLRVLSAATYHQRGVILSPTGTGKGLLICALVQMLTEGMGQRYIHIVVPTKDIRRQTVELLRLYDLTALVQTRQAFFKKALTNGSWIGAVILDEAHIGFGPSTQLVKALQSLPNVHARFGLTATLPETEEAGLYLEGCVGPVIAEVTMQEAQERGLLATPTIRLLSVQSPAALGDASEYQTVYHEGIVENRYRNTDAVLVAKEYVEAGKLVLLFVTQIAHGWNLMDLAQAIGLDAQFVHGQTDEEFRTELRHALNVGQARCVIATRVWAEGVNIPELEVCILVGAGKGHVGVIQRCGRVLRKTAKKEEAVIVDFLDTHRQLSYHVVERLTAYTQCGWL